MGVRLDTAIAEVFLHHDVNIVTTPNGYLTGTNFPVDLREFVNDPVCAGGRRSWEALMALLEAPAQLAFPAAVCWSEATCVS